MKETRLLQNLGLTEYESVIYENLLEHEHRSATHIVRDTGLHRPQVYAALQGLEDKKLIYPVKYKRRKHYGAVSPEKLETLFMNFEKNFFNKIEDYHQKYEKSRVNRPLMHFSEGDQAIRDAHLDVVQSVPKNGMYFRYMAKQDFNKNYVPKGYQNIRDKKGLERWVITSEASQKTKIDRLGRAIKFIPKTFDLFEYGMSMLMYEDKVTIIDYESESVIHIKHKKFSEFQQKIFKLLFSKL